MRADDPPRARPEGAGRLHVVVGLDLQHAGAHQTGDARPAQDRHGQDHLEHDDHVGRVGVVGEGGHEQDATEQQRDREEDVRDPRDQRVAQAALEAGEHTQGHAHDDRGQRGEHTDQDRGAGTVDRARVDVVALDVAAEPCVGVRPLAGLLEDGLGRVGRGEQLRHRGHHQEDRDEHDGDPEDGVLLQLPPGVRREGACTALGHLPRGSGLGRSLNGGRLSHG